MFEHVLASVLLLLGWTGLSWTIVLTPDQYTICPGTTAVIKELRVTPCDDVPCPLPQSTTPTIQIQFTPKSPIDFMDIQVFGIINRAEVPFRAISRNGCNTLTNADGAPACPITDLTQTYTYKAHVEVKSSYPALDLVIKIKMGPDVACLSFPARVTKNTSVS